MEVISHKKLSVSKAVEKAEAFLRDDETASASSKSMISLLLVMIQLLLEKLGVNSENSSTPPSQDPHRVRGSKRKARGEKKKPGGQIGHCGSTLKTFESPDVVEEISIDRRTIPQQEYQADGYEIRQVVNILISREVTEFRAERLKARDGTRFVAAFPGEVSHKVQYGSTVKSMAVYLSMYQLLPYARCREMFADRFGIPLSAGSLANFNKSAYTRLEKFEHEARKRIISEPVLHADETGININGRNAWLHGVGSPQFAIFHPHLRRGIEAIDDGGVLARFNGVLSHDHWKAYFSLDCLHALCNAHHLRELEAVHQNHGHAWAAKMKKLLLEMNIAVKHKASESPVSSKVINAMIEKYRKILEVGRRECAPPKKRVPGTRGRLPKSKPLNLLERLVNFEAETLRFLTNDVVPFTNNAAENDIRMTKVQQKVSGCFRSMEGAQIYCRIRSYLLTCQKIKCEPSRALADLFDGVYPAELLKLLPNLAE